jgi:hypothetical protein
MGTDCGLEAAMPIPNDHVVEKNIELEENKDHPEQIAMEMNES